MSIKKLLIDLTHELEVSQQKVKVINGLFALLLDSDYSSPEFTDGYFSIAKESVIKDIELWAIELGLDVYKASDDPTNLNICFK